MEPETQETTRRDPLALHVPEARSLQMRATVTEEEDGPGSIELVAQYWDPVENDYGEIFDRGCFDKSARERIPARRCKLTDGHRNTCRDTIGTIVEGRSTKEGFVVRADFAPTEHAQECRSLVKSGHVDECSIEFIPLTAGPEVRDGKNLWRVREAVFYGLSLLPYSSQGLNAVKSVRGGSGYQNLPLAPDATPWDPAAALMRVTAWCAGEPGQPNEAGSGLNFARFARAFARVSNRGAVEGYSLQIADLVGHRLCVVPAAVRAAALELHAQRDAMPADDLADARDVLDRYFARMRAELGTADRAPWDTDAGLGVAGILDAAGQIVPGRATHALDITKQILRALPLEQRNALIEEVGAGPATTPPTTDASGDLAARARLAEAAARSLDLALTLED